MTTCRVCAGPCESFISFGRMPVANGFLREEDFADEYFFDLAAAFCERCALPQLVNAVAPDRMFHGEYPFFTSSSRGMVEHFARFAAEVRSRFMPESGGLVVEIGSNDGTLLRHFIAPGVRHLGVEPSANVAVAALERGVKSVIHFFDEDSAAEILREEGDADVVLAANCFCHVHDLHALAANIDRVLKPRGVVVFEDPYVGDILDRNAYDQIYDEHMFYFSLAGVSRWLEGHGFEVVDVQPQSVHGGSMRYTVARPGTRTVGDNVEALRREERRRGLDRLDTFLRFRSRIEKSRDDLLALLRRARREEKRVVGYAATSKSTTVLNYCGITRELVEFICDTTLLKQGKFSPGMHIPVRPQAQFAGRYPEYALLFAWNHAREIMANERAFEAAGGRWISYVPEVALVD